MAKGSEINAFFLKTEHVVGDSVKFHDDLRLMPTQEYRYPAKGEFFSAGKTVGERVWYCYDRPQHSDGFAEYYILDFQTENVSTDDQAKTVDIIREVLSRNRSYPVYFTEEWVDANLYLFYGDEPGAKNELQIIYPDGSLS